MLLPCWMGTNGSGMFSPKVSGTKNGGNSLNLIAGYFGGRGLPYLHAAYIGEDSSILGT